LPGEVGGPKRTIRFSRPAPLFILSSLREVDCFADGHGRQTVGTSQCVTAETGRAAEVPDGKGCQRGTFVRGEALPKPLERTHIRKINVREFRFSHVCSARAQVEQAC
jgi:hypothetical protein